MLYHDCLHENSGSDQMQRGAEGIDFLLCCFSFRDHDCFGEDFESL